MSASIYGDWARQGGRRQTLEQGAWRMQIAGELQTARRFDVQWLGRHERGKAAAGTIKRGSKSEWLLTPKGRAAAEQVVAQQRGAHSPYRGFPLAARAMTGTRTSVATSPEKGLRRPNDRPREQERYSTRPPSHWFNSGPVHRGAGGYFR